MRVEHSSVNSSFNSKEFFNPELKLEDSSYEGIAKKARIALIGEEWARDAKAQQDIENKLKDPAFIAKVERVWSDVDKPDMKSGKEIDYDEREKRRVKGLIIRLKDELFPH